jgi:tRNA modification GTPase
VVNGDPNYHLNHDQNYNDNEDYDTYEEDTIYALATGGGGSGSSSSSAMAATAIAIIRLTGSHSLAIIQSMLVQGSSSKDEEKDIHITTNVNENLSKQKKRLLLQPRRAYLRQLYHPVTHEMLDEVILIYYQAPFSYTGEDCVEIQCHGSRAVIHDIVSTFQECYSSRSSSDHNNHHHPLYLRLAEPGEFTQRAYRNGKMDLLQIEALSDLIHADTSIQRKQALFMYNGQVSEIYLQWRQILIMALAHAEAIIDFGDDESLEESSVVAVVGDNNSIHDRQQQQQSNIWGRITVQVQDLIRQMEQQLRNERRGEMVRDGMKIAIIGPPNVGKSSLLNLLAVRDAAIVSNIAGTTRDIVEVPINLNGMKCIVQDTAGVRTSTTDTIEQIGIDRAIAAAQQADIIVAVIDATDPNTGWTTLSNLVNVNSPCTNHEDAGDTDANTNTDDSRRTLTLNPNHILVVYNKADLVDESMIQQVGQFNPESEQLLSQVGKCLQISCTSQQGIDTFLQTLTQCVMDRVNGNDNYSNDHSRSVAASSPSSSTILTNANTNTMITRTRHRQHILASKEALERFVVLSQQGPMMIDMAAEELRLAASELGRITGAVDVEDVLDKLFADFCIGK